MIKDLIKEDDPYLREIPEEYDFGKSLEYEPEELKNILIENIKSSTSLTSSIPFSSSAMILL